MSIVIFIAALLLGHVVAADTPGGPSGLTTVATATASDTPGGPSGH